MSIKMVMLEQYTVMAFQAHCVYKISGGYSPPILHVLRLDWLD